MSMNLIFRHKVGGYIDFPIQTPTELTKAVLREKSDKKKLAMIKKYMIECDWEPDDIKLDMKQIKGLLEDKNIVLDEI